MTPMEKTHLPAHANRRRVSPSREKHVSIFGESMGAHCSKIGHQVFFKLAFTPVDVVLVESFRHQIVVSKCLRRCTNR
jgi:hypothetical protein